MSRPLSPIASGGKREPAAELLISPLVGEMSGRTEGGAKDLGLSDILRQTEAVAP